MDFRNLKGEHLRRVIAVLAVAVTTYYLYWRVTETFNPNALFFSWTLWCAEVFGFFTTLLFFFTVWKPTTREAPETTRTSYTRLRKANGKESLTHVAGYIFRAPVIKQRCGRA